MNTSFSLAAIIWRACTRTIGSFQMICHWIKLQTATQSKSSHDLKLRYGELDLRVLNSHLHVSICTTSYLWWSNKGVRFRVSVVSSSEVSIVWGNNGVLITFLDVLSANGKKTVAYQNKTTADWSPFARQPKTTKYDQYLFHWPMQGPHALANTVPPNSLNVSAFKPQIKF